MEKSFKIEYHLDIEKEDIKDEKELMNNCEKRIFEMIQDGYYQGELFENQNDNEYRGWWKIKRN